MRISLWPGGFTIQTMEVFPWRVSSLWVDSDKRGHELSFWGQVRPERASGGSNRAKPKDMRRGLDGDSAKAQGIIRNIRRKHKARKHKAQSIKPLPRGGFVRVWRPPSRPWTDDSRQLY